MMRNKRAALEAINTVLSIVGIFVMILLFLVAFRLIPSPSKVISETEAENYGNFFINNYLDWPISTPSGAVTVHQALILYDQGGVDKNTYKELVLVETKNIMKLLFPDYNKPACFTIFLDDSAEIKEERECYPTKINAEAKLPTSNGVLNLYFRGS
ncbi:hypothetical protein GOV05_03145 [Candidatus Woesearchaeota archaeon]|nr:hypothetical protein [Candidatus Woesearchaeota archaeon]